MRFTLMVSLVISMCAAWPTVGADEPPVVEVQPGTAPEESENIGEVLVTASAMNSIKGRVYLFYGGNLMDTTTDFIFEGENPNDYFGRDGII